MIVPLIWLKDYIKTTKTAKEIAEAFTSLGLMLDKPIENDVLDLEHRMDRADWLSITGCARDLAAALKTTLVMPEGSKENPKPNNEKIDIKVECPENLSRFTTRIFTGVKVGESPDWIKERLKAYGMPAINNIVDITNFVMIELGQPLHAQDISKFEKPEILIRLAREGEQITTLDGTNVKLDTQTSVLTQNNKPIAIMGIVGGKETSVTDKTTDIILDAGNYNQKIVRETSRRLNIRNETASRCEKFLHPALTQIGIERATKLILEIAGGECYENIDYYPEEKKLKKMFLRRSRIEKVSGMSFDLQQIKDDLKALGYEIDKEDANKLDLTVPYFRTDVEVEDDIVSDILRINNFEKIPTTLINNPPPEEITQKIYDFEEKLRDILVKLGMHEHITAPLVKRNEGNTAQVKMVNALNSEQDAVRTTIYETLLPVYEIYTKHGIRQVGLFEIGKIYEVHGDPADFKNYKEIRVLECIHKSALPEHENNQKLKQILAGIFYELGISNYELKKTNNEVSILQNGDKLGILKNDSFTLYTERLLKTDKEYLRVEDKILNKIYEDITFEIEIGKDFGEIFGSAENFNPLITNVEVVAEFRVNSTTKAITLRVFFESAEMLSNEQIQEVKAALIEKIEKEYPTTIPTA